MESKEIVLDAASQRIVRELQQDATLGVQQLAERVGLSATPVWRRLQALQEGGVIRRRVALMDRELLGLSICVLAHVTLQRHGGAEVEAFERLVAASPEILECHAVTGEADYLVKVVATDMKAYDRFLQTQVFRTPGVASVRSNVVMREVKNDTALPVG